MNANKRHSIHRWLHTQHTHMKSIMCVLSVILRPETKILSQRTHSDRFYRLLTLDSIFSTYVRCVCSIHCVSALLKGFTVNPNTSETNWCWRTECDEISTQNRYVYLLMCSTPICSSTCTRTHILVLTSCECWMFIIPFIYIVLMAKFTYINKAYANRSYHASAEI